MNNKKPRWSLLSKLTLKNFRCFENFTVEFNERLTVLIGDNGSGKSTILDAISLAFYPFVGQLSRPARHILPSDVRKVPTSTEPVEMEPSYPVKISTQHRLRSKDISSTRSIENIANTTREAAALTTLAQGILEDLPTGNVGELPVIAYYGTGRLWKQKKKTEKKLIEQIDKSRLSAYSDALDPASSFEYFKEWFKYATLADVQERQLRGRAHNAPTAYSALIQEVQRAVDSCVKRHTGWGELRYDIAHQDVVLSHGSFGALSLTQLSDGIRGLIALVADIAYRCVRLNASTLGENIVARTPGIVLVDEIDLHLHPSWQQTVISSLQEAFPQIQWVLTTHSPQVLTSVSPECIRRLERHGQAEEVVFSLGASSEVVLEEIMGVDPRPPHVPVVKKLERYRELVSQGDAGTPEAQEIWEELRRWGGQWEPELRRLELQRRLQGAGNRK